MTPSDAVRALEDVARDLDLMVFGLEDQLKREAASGAAANTASKERQTGRERLQRLRRELEEARERILDVARQL